MENASKALLMAGGVLIGVLILALVIIFWTRMSGLANSDPNKEKQISEFNMQFESYNRGKKENKDGTTVKDVPVYGSDIITIINKVETYNRGGDDELFQQAFNSKVQYEPIEINIDLGTKLSTYEIFNGTQRINNIVENKRFIGTDKSGNPTGILSKYLALEGKYGKDFMNKLSANYTRLLKLMHVNENLTPNSSIKDENDSEEYGYVGAIKKVTGRNLAGTPSDGGLEDIDDKRQKGTSKNQMNTIKNYSDYTRFKTSQFICSKTDYNSKGQIKLMEFTFKSM